jgi:hypothetical protein
MDSVQQEYLKFERAMAIAMHRYRTNASAEKITEAITGARSQLDQVVEKLKGQSVVSARKGVPSIESLEARLEALKMLADARKR